MRLLTIFFTSLSILFGLFLLQRTISINSARHESQFKISERISEYTVNKPDHTLILTSELREISGLALSQNDQQLLAVQDELGVIFHVEKETGRIATEEKFGKKGDYEGVEYLDGMIYVVNSSGELFKMAAEKETEKIKTFLNDSYDIEGLGINSAGNRLLIASKEAGKGDKHLRDIYSYDPAIANVDEKPVITIDAKDLEARMGLKKPYFSPSAICTYEDKYYILSSKSKAIIVLDVNGNFLEGAKLSPSVHPQPEGMTIDQNGTLYISNEGGKGVAKIYVFNHQNQGK